MRIITQTLSAASLVVVMSLTSMTNAFAMPLPTSTSPTLSQVEQVQMRRDDDRRDRRVFRDRRAYRDNNGWYNGQRGYADRRAGYRRHSDGFWYPLAAFGAAAIIGGAIASQPRLSGGGSSHVEWCADRYRSYRASDNTYSPRAGVRAQCNSPY